MLQLGKFYIFFIQKLIEKKITTTTETETETRQKAYLLSSTTNNTEHTPHTPRATQINTFGPPKYILTVHMRAEERKS